MRLSNAAVAGSWLSASGCFSQQVSDIQYIQEAPDEGVTGQREKTAEQVRRPSRSRLDNTLILTGASFSRQTKTLTYQYDSNVPLHEGQAREHVRGFVCSNNLRRAFMRRGVTFAYVYLTPRGVLTYVIRNGDCR